ncbi:MAG: hypothetical protein Q9174_000206 [Haloplaca sp. 1 TL-2023]
MAAPFAKGVTMSVAKRARSTDSSRSGASTPAPKALKTEETGLTGQTPSGEGTKAVSVPAFLRQSANEIRHKFGELEYQQIFRVAEGRRNPDSRWVQDNSKQTRLRNRYLNVQPWSNSRIRLRVPEGESDYINASPISLTEAKTGLVFSYIAAQGPKDTNLSHFWHMVWHQTSSVAVIVMLTQTAESGREKCYQYFPLDEQAEAINIDPIEAIEAAPLGNVRVLEVTVDEKSRSTIRKLLLTFGQESKIVWHLLFSAWPDFEVPQDKDRDALFELLSLSAEKNGGICNPRIIHCSAGVGRSGSFIALEYLLAQIQSGAISEANDDQDLIFDLVTQLREQRMSMVQSEMQYAFLYEVVRERFLSANDSSMEQDPWEPTPGAEVGASAEGHTSKGQKSIAEGCIETGPDSTGKAPVNL